MRINKFIAAATGMSRRSADQALKEGRVLVNGVAPRAGQSITEEDVITLDGKQLTLLAKQTILLNKPAGYVTSREGQGSKTIYSLLPTSLHHLKPVGRLDKESSGLLLLTNDGDLAQQLTHPSHQKTKIYEVTLDAPLAPLHRQMITDIGVNLEDGPSSFMLERLHEGNDLDWKVIMKEGRNRQIRRTFNALGYRVMRLHRIAFGSYMLGDIPSARYTER